MRTMTRKKKTRGSRPRVTTARMNAWDRVRPMTWRSTCPLEMTHSPTMIHSRTRRWTSPSKTPAMTPMEPARPSALRGRPRLRTWRWARSRRPRRSSRHRSGIHFGSRVKRHHYLTGRDRRKRVLRRLRADGARADMPRRTRRAGCPRLRRCSRRRRGTRATTTWTSSRIQATRKARDHPPGVRSWVRLKRFSRRGRLSVHTVRSALTAPRGTYLPRTAVGC
mmetsp:Transcript_12202/g.56562  ORF Transcript_12202/g.56562 Transcript_12202/m.56562 type:complete len:222 (+) Transcript_12202:657-1322(+)